MDAQIHTSTQNADMHVQNSTADQPIITEKTYTKQQELNEVYEDIKHPIWVKRN